MAHARLLGHPQHVGTRVYHHQLSYKQASRCLVRRRALRRRWASAQQVYGSGPITSGLAGAGEGPSCCS